MRMSCLHSPFGWLDCLCRYPVHSFHTHIQSNFLQVSESCKNGSQRIWFKCADLKNCKYIRLTLNILWTSRSLIFWFELKSLCMEQILWLSSMCNWIVYRLNILVLGKTKNEWPLVFEFYFLHKFIYIYQAFIGLPSMKFSFSVLMLQYKIFKMVKKWKLRYCDKNKHYIKEKLFDAAIPFYLFVERFLINPVNSLSNSH